MANYIGWVLTEEGRKLITKSIVENTKIKIKKLKIGSGYNTGDDKKLNNLLEFKNEFNVSSFERKENYFECTFVVSNKNINNQNIVEKDFKISEMGIFIENDLGTETMLAYNKGTDGDYLQSFKGNNPIDIVQKCIFTIDDKANIVVELDDSITYVTNINFDKYKRETTEKINKKANQNDVITAISFDKWNLKYTKNNVENNIAMPTLTATWDKAGFVSQQDIKEVLAWYGIGTNNLKTKNINSTHYMANAMYINNTTRNGENIPNGRLNVINFYYNKYGTQFGILENDNPRAYIRRINNDNFEEWKELAFKDDLPKLKKMTISSLVDYVDRR